MKRILSVASALALLVLVSACESTGVVTPSPGNPPAAGASGGTSDAEKASASLTVPQPVSPINNAQIKNVNQPVTLLVGNAVTTGSVPLTYAFEVATDAGFANKVYAKDGLPQGANGQTSVALDKLKASTTYFWRSRSTSGAIVGPNSKAQSFTIGPEVILQAPVLSDPGSNATVSESPTLTINNSARTGPADRVFYRFDVADSSAFTTIVYSATVPERTDAPVTAHTLTVKLAEKTYWWRVLAADPVNGATSPYSSPNPFKVTKGIDLRTVNIILGPPDIGSWREGSKITEAYQADDFLCIFHTALGIWPSTGFFGDPSVPVEGNQWVFAFISGQWWGGAADWYRPGQACKNVDAQSIGRDAFYAAGSEPLHSWVPQSGEIFGVMSTTPARAWPGMATVDERTDVVLIRWP